jgi:hypothetical protein
VEESAAGLPPRTVGPGLHPLGAREPVTRRGAYVIQHTKDYEDDFTKVKHPLDHDRPGWGYTVVRPTKTAYDLDQ